MTNKELIILQSNLEKVDLSQFKEWESPNTRFDVLYQIARVKDKLKGLVEAIKSTLKVPDNLNEFYEGVNNINTLYASRDGESGKPRTFKIQDREVYDIPVDIMADKTSSYNTELKDLREKFKPIIDEYNKELKGYQMFLDKENTDFNANCIARKMLPLDISQDFIEKLFPLIIIENP